MASSGEKLKKLSLRNVSKTAVLIIGMALFGSIALFTALIVMANTYNLRASGAAYDSLRDTASSLGSESDGFDAEHIGALDAEMLEINPDYVCWLKIDGTDIDYPVVRGYNNKQYLNTSFHGESNLAGAVFMDYRNTGNFTSHKVGESLPHIILYGHNVPGGGIFSDLRKFLDEKFLEENRIITIIVNDQVIEYEIFSARLTDIQDPAYYLNFSTPRSFPNFADRIDAPLIATQIITLSTCTRGGSDDERLVVQGYRILD